MLKTINKRIEMKRIDPPVGENALSRILISLNKEFQIIKLILLIRFFITQYEGGKNINRKIELIQLEQEIIEEAGSKTLNKLVIIFIKIY